MKRSEFDNLSFMEQVEYVNKKLLEGTTITNICKSIGIGRTTIRDRFKSISYEYNKDTKQYESFIDVIDPGAEICATIDGNYESSNGVVINNNTMSSNKIVVAEQVNNKLLEDLILNYNDMNNKLNEVYSWYQKSSNKVVIEENKLNIEAFEGDLVTRSYKLYEPIQKEFLEFCKKNNRYRVQDILSQALKEFIDKYK